MSRVQRRHQHIIGNFGDESLQSVTCTGADNCPNVELNNSQRSNSTSSSTVVVIIIVNVFDGFFLNLENIIETG